MKNIKWDGKAKGKPLGNRIFIWLIKKSGILPAYILLIPVTFFFAIFDKKGRLGILKFYKMLKGKRVGFLPLYKTYYEFGMALVDRIAFMVGSKVPFRYEYNNEELIRSFTEKGQGVILVSAHVGNWEIAGNMLSNRLGTRVNAVMLDNEQYDIKEVFKDVYNKRIFNIIPLKTDGPETMITINNALTNGEIVSIHSDRTIDYRGRKVTFLGKEALFPDGAFSIATITKVVVIPVIIIKKGFLTYSFTAGEAMDFSNANRSNRNELINCSLIKFVGFMESFVKKYPSQWYNFFDFWE